MKTVHTAVILCDESLLGKQWLPFISPQRTEKTGRLRHDSDKIMSTGAELALHAALSLTGSAVAASSQPLYRYDDRGKPILSLPDRHISISHSGGIAVCAAADIPVGADIEKHRRITAGMTRMMLSPEEASEYVSGRLSEDDILAKWTVKEAYLKLTGDGISRHSMDTLTAADGIIKKSSETAAYYHSAQLNNGSLTLECTAAGSGDSFFLTCAAFEPISLEAHIFTPSSLAALLNR